MGKEVTKKEILLVFIFFILIVFLMYPNMIKDPFHKHPALRADGYFMMAVLTQQSQKYFSDPFNILKGRWMYPFEYPLLLTEPAPFTAIVYAPVYLLTGNPVLALNALFFISIVPTGIFGYLLIFRLIGNRIGSLIGALFIIVSPYTSTFCAYPASLSLTWILGAMWFLINFLEQKLPLRNFLLFMIFFIINGLSLWINCLILSIASGTIVIYFMIKQRNKKYILYVIRFIIVSSIIFTAAFLPIIIKTAIIHKNMELSRTIASQTNLAFDPANFIKRPYFNLFHGGNKFYPSEIRGSFIGFAALTLFIIGIFNKNKYRWLFFMLLAVFLILALGPEFKFAGKTFKYIPAPYKILTSVIPPLKAMRGVGRLIAGFFIAVGYFIGLGYCSVYNILKDKNKQLIAGIFFIAVIFIENGILNVPYQYSNVKNDLPSVYKWLAKEPDNFVVSEIPMRMGNPDYNYEALRYCYYSLFHKKRLVNGISSFVPHSYRYLIDNVFHNLNAVGVSALYSLGADYIVVHNNGKIYPDALPFIEKIKEFKKSKVYRIKKEKFNFDVSIYSDISETVQCGQVSDIEVVVKNNQPDVPTVLYPLNDGITKISIKMYKDDINIINQEYKLYAPIIIKDSNKIKVPIKVPAEEGIYNVSIISEFRGYTLIKHTIIKAENKLKNITHIPNIIKYGHKNIIKASIDFTADVSETDKNKVKGIKIKIRNNNDYIWVRSTYDPEQLYTKGSVAPQMKIYTDDGTWNYYLPLPGKLLSGSTAEWNIDFYLPKEKGTPIEIYILNPGTGSKPLVLKGRL